MLFAAREEKGETEKDGEAPGEVNVRGSNPIHPLHFTLHDLSQFMSATVLVRGTLVHFIRCTRKRHVTELPSRRFEASKQL